MPLFMLKPIGAGVPPKSRWWIRRLLEQIRDLVHGPPIDHANSEKTARMDQSTN
jgi:hypothetical protein